MFLLFGVTKLALAMMTALNVLSGVGIVYYSIRIAWALFGSEVIAFLVGIVFLFGLIEAVIVIRIILLLLAARQGNE